MYCVKQLFNVMPLSLSPRFYCWHKHSSLATIQRKNARLFTLVFTSASFSLPRPSAGFFFIFEFPQLCQLFHCYLGFAAEKKNNAHARNGCAMTDALLLSRNFVFVTSEIIGLGDALNSKRENKVKREQIYTGRIFSTAITVCNKYLHHVDMLEQKCGLLPVLNCKYILNFGTT